MTTGHVHADPAAAGGLASGETVAAAAAAAAVPATSSASSRRSISAASGSGKLPTAPAGAALDGELPPAGLPVAVDTNMDTGTDPDIGGSGEGGSGSGGSMSTSASAKKCPTNSRKGGGGLSGRGGRRNRNSRNDDSFLAKTGRKFMGSGKKSASKKKTEKGYPCYYHRIDHCGQRLSARGTCAKHKDQQFINLSRCRFCQVTVFPHQRNQNFYFTKEEFCMFQAYPYVFEGWALVLFPNENDAERAEQFLKEMYPHKSQEALQLHRIIRGVNIPEAAWERGVPFVPNRREHKAVPVTLKGDTGSWPDELPSTSSRRASLSSVSAASVESFASYSESHNSASTVNTDAWETNSYSGTKRSLTESELGGGDEMIAHSRRARRSMSNSRGGGGGGGHRRGGSESPTAGSVMADDGEEADEMGQRPMQKSTFFGAFQLQPARRLRDLRQRLYPLRNKEATEKMKSPPLSSNVTPVGAPFSGATSFFNRSSRQQQRQAQAAATAAANHHHQRSPSAEHSLSRSSPSPHVRTPSGGSHVAAPVSPALTPVTTGRGRRQRPSISYSGSHSIAVETPTATVESLPLSASNSPISQLSVAAASSSPDNLSHGNASSSRGGSTSPQPSALHHNHAGGALHQQHSQYQHPSQHSQQQQQHPLRQTHAHHSTHSQAGGSSTTTDAAAAAAEKRPSHSRQLSDAEKAKEGEAHLRQYLNKLHLRNDAIGEQQAAAQRNAERERLMLQQQQLQQQQQQRQRQRQQMSTQQLYSMQQAFPLYPDHLAQQLFPQSQDTLNGTFMSQGSMSDLGFSQVGLLPQQQEFVAQQNQLASNAQQGLAENSQIYGLSQERLPDIPLNMGGGSAHTADLSQQRMRLTGTVQPDNGGGGGSSVALHNRAAAAAAAHRAISRTALSNSASGGGSGQPDGLDVGVELNGGNSQIDFLRSTGDDDDQMQDIDMSGGGGSSGVGAGSSQQCHHQHHHSSPSIKSEPVSSASPGNGGGVGVGNGPMSALDVNMGMGDVRPHIDPLHPDNHPSLPLGVFASPSSNNSATHNDALDKFTPFASVGGGSLANGVDDGTINGDMQLQRSDLFVTPPHSGHGVTQINSNASRTGVAALSSMSNGGGNGGGGGNHMMSSFSSTGSGGSGSGHDQPTAATAGSGSGSGGPLPVIAPSSTSSTASMSSSGSSHSASAAPTSSSTSSQQHSNFTFRQRLAQRMQRHRQ